MSEKVNRKLVYNFDFENWFITLILKVYNFDFEVYNFDFDFGTLKSKINPTRVEI